jgi:K+-sensing histidine kinase KdpD
LGTVGASTIFAATYFDAGSTSLVLTYALAGLLFAYSVARTAVLGGAIVGHVLFAVGAGAFWPIVLHRTRPLEVHEPQTAITLVVAIVIAVVIAVRRPLV